MNVVNTSKEFYGLCHSAPRPLALVPTMGALHEGHLSLVRHAKRECATVAVTIFVNPIQFNRATDLDQYPRNHTADANLLVKEGVDFVFIPTTDEIYPPEFATTVEVAGPAIPLEGVSRPSHFRGVTTIVTKLLVLAMPDTVYLGRKDVQQAAVLNRLVDDLKFPISVRVMPTVRETDGLAMSSRNGRLLPHERAAAPVVYRALQAAEYLFINGERTAVALEGACLSVLQAEPLVEEIEYVALVNPTTFSPLNQISKAPATLTIAVRIGKIRLIDNISLGSSSRQALP